MPRSQQSLERRVIAYFRTTPLEIASVIYDLCADELRLRKAKSTEARERALGGQKKATPKPAKVADPVSALSRPVAQAAPPAKKKAKKRVRPSRAKRPPTAAQIESEVAAEQDGAVLESEA